MVEQHSPERHEDHGDNMDKPLESATPAALPIPRRLFGQLGLKGIMGMTLLGALGVQGEETEKKAICPHKRAGSEYYDGDDECNTPLMGARRPDNDCGLLLAGEIRHKDDNCGAMVNSLNTIKCDRDGACGMEDVYLGGYRHDKDDACGRIDPSTAKVIAPDADCDKIAQTEGMVMHRDDAKPIATSPTPTPAPTPTPTPTPTPESSQGGQDHA